MAKFLFNTILCLILSTALEITLVGCMWILRIALVWLFDYDVMEIKRK